MNSLLKFLLITVVSAYTAGCSVLAPSSEEVEYITPVRNLSLNLGESAIVHGAMEQCGRKARFWSDVSFLLPYSETGFFSNAGTSLMKSEKCNGLAPVLAVRFTANKTGTESFTVLGDPMTIVVSDGSTNFLQSGIPNPGASASSGTSPKTTGASEPSMLGSMFGTLREWVGRGEQ